MVWLACLLPASANVSLPTKHAAENPPASPVSQLDRVLVEGKALRDLPPIVDYTPRQSSGGDGGGGGGAANTPKNPSDPQVADPPADNNTKTGCSSDSAAPQTSPTTRNPVIIATGEKIKTEDDFDAGSDYGLSHSRTYRSFGAGGTMFGAKWFSKYNYPSLKRYGCYNSPDYPGVCVPRTVVFTQPDGASYTYTLDGDAMYTVNGSEAMGRIYYDGPDLPVPWRVHLPRKTLQYNTLGRIQAVYGQGGSGSFTYTYAANGYEPIKVTNGAGRTIEFT